MRRDDITILPVLGPALPGQPSPRLAAQAKARELAPQPPLPGRLPPHAAPAASPPRRRGPCSAPPLLSRQGAVAFLAAAYLLVLAFLHLPRRLRLAPPPLAAGAAPWRPPATLPLGAAHAALVRNHLDLGALAAAAAVAAPGASPPCPPEHGSYAALAQAVRAWPLRGAPSGSGGRGIGPLPPRVRLAVVAALPPGAPTDAALVRAPGMTPQTAAAFCAAPSAYPPDFQLLLRPAQCADGQGEARTFAPPWHNPPSDAALILATTCAHVESYVGDNAPGPVWRIIGGSVLSLQGPNASWVLADASLRDHRPAALAPLQAPPHLPPPPPPRLERHALLATPGPLRCGWCPGHFFLEALPVLLLMDALLPPAVPLLWPGGALPEAVALALRAQGAALRRPLVLEPREPTIHQVDNLLYFQSGTAGGVPTSWLAQRYANGLLRGMVAGEQAAGAGAGAAGAARAALPLRAVLALREGARTRQLVNAEAVAAALARALPRGAVVDVFTPGAAGGGGFLADGARFARACLVVGVHGANLANALFMEKGCTLIELAPLDAFSDYSALGRNLGLQYYVSLGAAGAAHAAEGFEADVEDLERVLAKVVGEGLLGQ
jgi:hypothetical protein